MNTQFETVFGAYLTQAKELAICTSFHQDARIRGMMKGHKRAMAGSATLLPLRSRL